ncbi:DUF4238 domain-containing protein [Metabacillus halosaccharovorans]|uniref:DUF4238 domain-containing protein n=1 Tax=Metabacillus halosaccharovorans TaxID=930124 RepID=UPI000C80B2C4|nr:DUF4238 domain-containing protein [Metabacillus halosaccharovorans]MCM3444189.1 DUF4238 domain-containing protein [Metabacillus halosaccharovorans]PMC36404.1 hypothetical protein CJ195_16585 [Bacillus sp. UMB0899]
MGQKSRQHYVPKFYLRNFSNTEKSINTYNLTNEKYIENASIKDMCQKNNFYGADKRVETFLDKEIERKAAVIISNILESREFPENIEDYVHLISFLLVSEARNLKSADSSNQMVDYMVKTLMKGNPEFKELGKDLDSFTVEYNEPANHMIQMALENVPLVLDLTPILIVEQTGSRKFITSDNPLIRYNSFYFRNNYPGGFGYITRGLQMFFPISHNKCILLYDRYVYHIPAEQNNVLVLKRARDIDQLNELFYLNAYNNVFFNQKTKDRYIEEIHCKNKKTPKIKELNREVNSFKEINSNNEIIHFSQNRVSKKFDFSWLNYTDHSKKLIIPSHMGGINRVDSPFIREKLGEIKKRHSESYYVGGNRTTFTS